MTDPDADTLARRCAETMYATDRACQALGIEIDDVAAGRATARMRVTESMLNGHGLVHGGYLFLLADAAFAYACNTYGVVTVAQGAQVSFIRPVKAAPDKADPDAEPEVRLTAVAVERTRYGRNGIYDVTIQTADGTVVAEFRGHSRTLDDQVTRRGARSE